MAKMPVLEMLAMITFPSTASATRLDADVNKGVKNSLNFTRDFG
jgi:hypothetical protein